MTKIGIVTSDDSFIGLDEFRNQNPTDAGKVFGVSSTGKVELLSTVAPGDIYFDTVKESATSPKTLTTALSEKVAKETGKSLISDAAITKLNGVEEGAQKNVQSDWEETDNTKDSFIQNKPNIQSKIDNAIGTHNTSDDAHNGRFAALMVKSPGPSYVDHVPIVNSVGTYELTDIIDVGSESLSTSSKKIIPAINELRSLVTSLGSQTKIVIADDTPDPLIPNTLYYINNGTGAGVYSIYVCSEDESGTPTLNYIGTTELDAEAYVKKADVINNLLSQEEVKPLSAKQGKILNGIKLDKFFGTSFANYTLKVGEDGYVTATNASALPQWGTIVGTLTDQGDLKNALLKKLGIEYSAEEDGYVATVDSIDHKLKVMPNTAATVTFTKITGNVSDNPKLKEALDKKVNFLDIYDSHNSTDTDKALSANQGYVIYNKISAHENNSNNPHYTTLANLTDTDTSLAADGNILLYDAPSNKWIPTTYIDDVGEVSNEKVWSSLKVSNAISSLNSVATILVVSSQPATPVLNTLYYIETGTTGLYNIKLYAKGEDGVAKWFDMGQTQVDVSNLVKKTEVVDDLNSVITNLPLSANQGYVLNTSKARVVFSETEPDDLKPGEFWANSDNASSVIYGTEILTEAGSTQSITDALRNKVDNNNALKQTIYDIVHPVGSFAIQYSTSDKPASLIPSGVTATWSDVSSSYHGRYFMVNKNETAGKQLGEQLPNITGSANQMFFEGGFGGSGALKPDGYTGIYAKGGSYGAGGKIVFDASWSNSVYTSGGSVRPLTNTVKFWKRTA